MFDSPVLSLNFNTNHADPVKLGAAQLLCPKSKRSPEETIWNQCRPCYSYTLSPRRLDSDHSDRPNNPCIYLPRTLTRFLRNQSISMPPVFGGLKTNGLSKKDSQASLAWSDLSNLLFELLVKGRHIP